SEAPTRFRLDVETKPLKPSAACTLTFSAPRPATDSEITLQQARSVFYVAYVLIDQGKFDEALAPSQQALSLREKVLAPDDPAVAGSVWQVAHISFAKGDYPAAESLFLRALKIFEKAQGPNGYSVGLVVNNLGIIYEQTGDFDKAELYFQRGIAIREQMH